MRCPSNGKYIIQGEISMVVMAMRRSSRWSSNSHRDDADPLLGSFSKLKDVLNNVTDLHEVEPNAFLSPFLEVIRSENTTGPITGLALTSVNKFLSYGLVDPACDVASPAIENTADAVTHARFVGTDPGSDEVVLMKILHVLQTLLLCPAGALLTNESLCEIMQSCFRICFEMRLSELLRKSAENILMNMVQLLFLRLPQFKEDSKWVANMKKLKMKTGGVNQARVGRRKKSSKPKKTKVGVTTPMQQAGATSITPQVSDCLPALAHTHTSQREPVSKSDTEHNGGNQIDKTELITAVEAGNEFSTQVFSNELEQIVESINTKIFCDDQLNMPETDAGVKYVHATRDSIATTPVEGTTIIDIVKGFQDADQSEDIEVIEDTIPDIILVQSPDGGLDMPVQNRVLNEEGDIHRTQSNADFKDHISLAISTDESLVRSSSEVSLPQSEVGEDESSQSQHSIVDTTEFTDNKDDFINPRGVRFTLHQQHSNEGAIPLIPYGLPCVRELFRFLISLTNPLDCHNTDVMIHMGLSLLTVALESGADHISKFASLVYLVKDDMCRHLFTLVQSDQLSLCTAALRMCFLLFESLRSHLKLQLEMYLTKLSEIITSEHPRITYDIRELALESLVQLWRIPGLVTELYLNYDCDLYCASLFEDLTKLLSKNAFPVSGLFSTHLLSLDALLTVIDSIEQHCHCRILKLTGNKQEVGKLQRNYKGKIESTGLTEDGKEEKTFGSATSAFVVAQKVIQENEEMDPNKSTKHKEPRKVPIIKPNRMVGKGDLPITEELSVLKQRKRVYHTGTEYFNQKPPKGLAYLHEQGLLSDPLDTGEIITFLKENPKIDKKVLGEYLSKRTSNKLLEAFVKSFHFEDLRIDEALRQYLETFRLPGEAPVISIIMEHFADHWHKSNGEPFANADAAFMLAYAVIMLNVDQHNHNVKKQNIPMTVEEFKKNLTKTNGGEDFEPEMLVEIYNAIKNEEIVMPSEHTGIVRDNYLWKVLLKRGSSKEGLFVHAQNGAYDHDLFTLIWGPTVAALSFVFDKSSDEAIISKAISGFRKCAMISAHYGMSDVFDNLVISLCKFATLLSSAETPEHLPISFGMNMKAQLSARTMFSLACQHGDMLREGWKNILDCMLQLYRAKLLPKSMIEVEDFLHPSLKICLIKEDTAGYPLRSESGVLSSLYSYLTMSEPATNKGPDEEKATKQATKCIQECQLEQLIVDSKFLREESLHELIKALINASQGPEYHNTMGTVYDEDAAIFFFEQFITCVLQNRDRMTPIWQSVREHICSLIVNASKHTFMVERAVVGLLRISIRLLRREEIVPQVLSSLQILLMMKPHVIHSAHICEQISYGLHELLQTNAANIEGSQDWYTLFVLLEVVGGGISPPPVLQVNAGVDVSEGLMEAGAQSDSDLPSSSSVLGTGSDKGYTSDSELETRRKAIQTEYEIQAVPGNSSWMLVNRDELYKNLPMVNQYSIELNETLQTCSSKSLLKSTETLSFLVRDAAYITPLNFESCVHAIWVFAEASLNGGHKNTSVPPKHMLDRKNKLKSVKSSKSMKKSQSSSSHIQLTTSSDEEAETGGLDTKLHSLSIQLLDLMHTLHTRANGIYLTWLEENRTNACTEGMDLGTEALWMKCWCPLLQGIARLCCDARRQVRSQALTYLQRALLVHDLQILSALEWEACFNKILFPLLFKLLENTNTNDLSGMEETRMRASSLLCKVFLQHLTPLLSLSTFTAIWLTILDFMDKYMHANRSDLLAEAIPESLKNMLLVMDTAGIFQTGDGTNLQLWNLTWDRIGTFLPHLKDELFKQTNPEPSKLAIEREETPTQEPELSSILLGSKDDHIAKAAPDGNHSTTYTTSQTAHPVGGDKNGCLTTQEELPSAASFFLHTPLPSIPNSISTDASFMDRNSSPKPFSSLTMSPSDPVLRPAMPLLLNPGLMKGTGIHLVSGQAHMASQLLEASQGNIKTEDQSC